MGNYRPGSILSCLRKVVEKHKENINTISNKITSYININLAFNIQHFQDSTI